MSISPKILIIGAGIVGCALADEITRRGYNRVTVVDQGPLFRTGGSTSHAPGLVFRTNASKAMTEFADYTTRKYAALTLDGEACFTATGGLEIAASPERWTDLQRRHGWATAWGLESSLLSAEESAALHSLVDVAKIYGGFYLPGDGLANAVNAARAQATLAEERGARFIPHQTVTGIRRANGRVRAVVTDKDEFPADIVVSCAGMWGPRIGAMVDQSVPLVPMAHQYVKTAPVPLLADATVAATRPILRHQDQDLYFREHFDRIGIGAYGHRPMPIAPEEIPHPDRVSVMPSIQPFTESDFDPWWREAVTLLPALGETKIEEGINGLFSFTTDGMPLLGESRDTAGFWLAEAVWITHSAGVAKAVAEWIVEGQPSADIHECDINRFEASQLAPAYVQQRARQGFIEVYDIIHPLQPKDEPRPLRVSPFYGRQLELGAYFLESNGWERPHWYEDNLRRLRGLDAPDRDEWAGRYWSPIAAAEAHVTRRRVAMYDMTPLKRIEVTGPGALAFLQRLTTNQLDKPPGRVTYTLMLNPDGGIRSDMTVARLDDQHFRVGANGELDLDWMIRHLPADGSVHVRDITPGTCCIGLWGPLARELIQPLSDNDFSAESFRFFHARPTYIEHVPVLALRVSYVGELGWELYTSADLGLQLWDTLWDAGQQFGIIAAGRSAFNSLRLEKGYRGWGTDMTTEHNPYEAGVEFAVRMEKGDFIGRSALAEAGPPTRRLTCLTLPDRSAIVMGKEPVYVDGRPAGYVTSADFGYTIDQPIAYAWLPTTAAKPGQIVEIEYFGERIQGIVTEEPLFDPKMERLRG